MTNELKVFTGNGNPRLGQAVCEYLRIPLGDWRVVQFSDGELYCQILENVRGTDVFVIPERRVEPFIEHPYLLLEPARPVVDVTNVRGHLGHRLVAGRQEGVTEQGVAQRRFPTVESTVEREIWFSPEHISKPLERGDRRCPWG